jgi:hypothetical protein
MRIRPNRSAASGSRIWFSIDERASVSFCLVAEVSQYADRQISDISPLLFLIVTLPLSLPTLASAAPLLLELRHTGGSDLFQISRDRVRTSMATHLRQLIISHISVRPCVWTTWLRTQWFFAPEKNVSGAVVLHNGGHLLEAV